jgi:hypothetical protein
MKAKMLALLLANLSLAAFGGAVQAQSLLHEGWEAAWLFTGAASVDCTKSCAGACSLKIAPASGATGSALRSETIPLQGQTRVSFQFLASSTAGDTDTNFRVRFSDGTEVLLHMTSPISNNKVSLIVSGGASHTAFASWSANTCHTAAIVIDPNLCLAWGELNGAQSLLLPIPCSANTISSLEMEGVSWSGFTATFWYDEIDVAP